MIKTVFYEEKKITILGTAHISKKNKEQVKDVILSEKPDVVAVELDKQRFYSMMNKKKRETKFTDILRSKKPFLFLTYYVLSKFQKKIAYKFNITPGEEMLQAVHSAREVNSKILLADRDAQLTLQKLLKCLSFLEKIKIFLSGFSMKKEIGDFSIESLLEEVEKKEESKQVNKIMNVFMKKHKKLKRILIDERDQFIAYQLQLVLKDENVNNIVLVVGAGHVQGIINNLDNKNIDIKKIVSFK